MRRERKRCPGRSHDIPVRDNSSHTTIYGSQLTLCSSPFSVGHHSTSDDSFAYRPRSEVEDHIKSDNPLPRFRLFLEEQGWWTAEDEEEMKARVKKSVLAALKRAESRKRHELKELFTDVYGGPEPWNIVRSSERRVGVGNEPHSSLTTGPYLSNPF